MKKLVILAAALVMSVSAYAQGTVLFNNLNPAAGVNAPVFNVGGTDRLSGSQFKAQLWAGASEATLAPVAVADFRTGTGAGYFVGGSTTVPGIAGGNSAVIQVRAWDSATGADFNSAGLKGSSKSFTVTLGGAGNPPSLPAALVGLESFSLVPEPSTIALALVGAAALLFRRRK